MSNIMQDVRYGTYLRGQLDRRGNLWRNHPVDVGHHPAGLLRADAQSHAGRSPRRAALRVTQSLFHGDSESAQGANLSTASAGNPSVSSTLPFTRTPGTPTRSRTFSGSLTLLCEARTT